MLTERLAVEKDIETLRQIVLSLGRTGSYEDLLSLSAHPNYNRLRTARYKAAVYLFSRGIVPDQLISECVTSLSSSNKSERQTAAIALFRVQPPVRLHTEVASILEQSGNSDPFIRYAAARLLRQQQFSQKPDLFRRLISDPDWRVRYETALAVPSISASTDIWISLLNDRNSYVVSCALKNPPENITVDTTMLKQIEMLLSSESSMVRDAAGYFICSGKDPDFDEIRRALLNSNKLTAGILTGKSKYITSRDDFNFILSQINHQNKSVATAAYIGLYGNIDSLLDQKIITQNDLQGFLIAGLKSGDPVQIYLASDYIQSTSVHTGGLETYLYRCLDHKGFQFVDARRMVIRALEKINSPDAPKHLRPLLNSRHRQLQEASYRLLTDVYHETVSAPIPGPDPFLYNRLDKLEKYGRTPLIRLETTRGTMLIRCNAFFTPYTVAAFLDRVEDNFYNGMVFHRVVPNFVIQTGDPREDGWGGPNYHLQTERSPVSYEAGSVGMASAGPDTEGSQFFITTSPQYHLDYNYTLFGKIVEGMDVVKSIEVGDKIISGRIVSR